MKRLKWMPFCLGLFLLSGCGRQEQAEVKADSAQDAETFAVSVTASEETVELEEGLSLVRLNGDDGFQDFLAQGGAESDAGVADYVTQRILDNRFSLSFSSLPFGCSTVAVAGEDGNRLFGRNFDWYSCEALLLENHPTDGYASLSTVNTDFITASLPSFAGFFLKDGILAQTAVYAPLDGMNEMGLCVSVNMIEDSVTITQDTGRPDLTTTTAVRLLLNNAATTEEAVALLGEYDLHASFGYMVHLAVSDAEGNNVVIEYIDDQMVVTETDIVTNFYLTPGEKYGIGTSQSHERAEILQNFTQSASSFSAEEVAGALESVSKHHWNDGETTEWSVIFDQENLTARYYHRENFDHAYQIELSTEEE